MPVNKIPGSNREARQHSGYLCWLPRHHVPASGLPRLKAALLCKSTLYCEDVRPQSTATGLSPPAL